MRKLRIFGAEVVGVGILLGWLFLRHPDIFDSVVPWTALAVMWHITWEFILDLKPVRAHAGTVIKRCGKMAWIVVFTIGGLISIFYWYSIKTALTDLAQHPNADKPAPPATSQPTSVAGPAKIEPKVPERSPQQPAKRSATPKPAVGPRIGSGPDAYKDVSDVQVGQWAIEEADKIDEMASEVMKSGKSPVYQAVVRKFTQDFKSTYIQDITDLRTEILKRLGPDGKDPREITAWRLLTLDTPPGWPERISPSVVKDYAPYLHLLGLRLKRRAVPRNRPLALEFSEKQIAPNKPEFPHRILVTINTKMELSTGYIVVDVKGPMASIACDFQGSKMVTTPQFVDNKELSKILARSPTSDSYVYALQIGEVPLMPSAPMHVEVYGPKEIHVS